MNEVSKMEMIFLALTTVATITAAVAAIYSCKVSKLSLAFQKQSAKNQSIQPQLISIKNGVLQIQSTLNNIYNTPDEDFEKIDPIFSNLKKEINLLSYQIPLDNEILEILNYPSPAYFTEDKINSAIKAINNTIEKIWR